MNIAKPALLPLLPALTISCQPPTSTDLADAPQIDVVLPDGDASSPERSSIQSGQVVLIGESETTEIRLRKNSHGNWSAAVPQNFLTFRTATVRLFAGPDLSDLLLFLGSELDLTLNTHSPTKVAVKSYSFLHEDFSAKIATNSDIEQIETSPGVWWYMFHLVDVFLEVRIVGSEYRLYLVQTRQDTAESSEHLFEEGTVDRQSANYTFSPTKRYDEDGTILDDAALTAVGMILDETGTTLTLSDPEEPMDFHRK